MIQYIQPFDLYIHFKRFTIVLSTYMYMYFYLLQGDSLVGPRGSMELRTTERANSYRKKERYEIGTTHAST